MVSKIYQVLGFNALSENNGSQDKNVSNNGCKSTTCSENSADRLTEEFSGILSIN